MARHLLRLLGHTSYVRREWILAASALIVIPLVSFGVVSTGSAAAALPCCATGASTPTTVNFVESSQSSQPPQNGVSLIDVPRPVDGSELVLATLATRGSGSGLVAPKGWHLLREAADSDAGETVKIFYSFPPNGERLWYFLTGPSDAGGLVEVYSGVNVSEPFAKTRTGTSSGKFSMTAPTVNVAGSARFSVSLFVTTPTSGYSVLAPSKETGWAYSEPQVTMTLIAADRVLSGSGVSSGAVVDSEQVKGGLQRAVTAQIILNHRDASDSSE